MGLAIFVILVNLATVVLTILAIVHAVRLRSLRSVRWLLVLSACFLVASFCTMGTFIADSFDEKVAFFYWRVLGMVFVPPSWLYLISAIFDRWNWLHKKWVMVIVLAPTVVNFFLALYPATRHLLFTDYQPFSYHGISAVQFKLGHWYGPFFLWSMVLMLGSYVLSAVIFVKERGYRRRQILTLNAGFGFAMVLFVFLRSQELEWIFSDSSSILITQIGILYTVVRHRLLSIVPLAMLKIFQKFPDPVLVIDDRNHLMGASDRAVSFFGLPENFLGQPIEKILPAVPLLPGELVLKGVTQVSHHFHLVLEKISEDVEGSPGTVIFFRDIGSQKDEESRLNAGLEFRARLLALFAHDLMGFVDSQVLITQTLQKNAGLEYREQFELLSSSAQASQELVSNVTNWVKSQGMQFRPHPKSFEWNLLLQETIEHMQSRLTIKGVEVIFSSTQNPVLGEGDSEMLASVFRNILSNSVRATPKGKTIFVNLSINRGNAEIRVRDEGCGLDSAQLDTIRESSKEFLLAGVSKTHGSGIGLMIARHFISLHHGHFQINSNLGKGTEVLFSVPL